MVQQESIRWRHQNCGLLKNVSEEGGTGKLKSFWEETFFKIVNKKSDIPVYEIVPENGHGNIKTVHKNLLMNC